MVWGVAWDNSIWHRNGPGGQWAKIEGGFFGSVQVGKLGMFGTAPKGAEGLIFYRVGTHENPTSAGTRFQVYVS